LINLEGVGHDCNPSVAALRLYSHGRNDHSHPAGIDHPHRRNTHLRFTVLKSGITLRDDLEFTIPGCDDAKILLVPPPEGAPSYRVLGWLDIERNAVLNHQIFSGRALPLDRNLDGILVAQSFDLLPSQFQSGMSITAKIRFTDLSGNVFTSDVRLGVERCEQSLVRPEEWPIRAGASYRHSSLAQDQELRGRDPKRMGGIASVKKGEPAVRSHV